MEKVLLIDDEPLITNSLKRGLAGDYHFLSATSGAEGLSLLKANPTVAIIVTDMSMPSMTGSEFLKESMKCAPDAVRVMLTGLADQKTAVRAINEGAIYRFLTKPCSTQDFEDTLKDCMVRRQLQKQERDLLQNTLGGLIGLITDLLSFVDPSGVQHAIHMRKIIRELNKSVFLGGIEVELAAMLAGIGKLSLPLELLVKNANHEVLSDKEKTAFDQYLGVSSRLLKQIPKLDKVSLILDAAGNGGAPEKSSPVHNGVIGFRVAGKISAAIQDGEPTISTLKRISDTLRTEELELFAPLLSDRGLSKENRQAGHFEVSFSDLCPGQRFVEDVTDKNGKLLLKKGFLVSEAIIERIKNHHELVGVKTPFFVNERTPTKDER